MSDTARKMFPVETVLALAVAKKGADVKDIAGYITGRSIVCDACAAAVAPFAAAWLAKLSPKFLDMNYTGATSSTRVPVCWATPSPCPPWTTA